MCDGLVVQHPDFGEVPPVKPRWGKEKFRKALGLGGEKTVVGDWKKRGLVMRGEWPEFDVGSQGYKKVGYGM